MATPLQKSHSDKVTNIYGDASDHLRAAIGAMMERNEEGSEIFGLVLEASRRHEAEKQRARRRLIIVSLGGLVLIGATLFGTAPRRYVVINAERPIKLDRWTGKTWVQESYTNTWRETTTR